MCNSGKCHFEAGSGVEETICCKPEWAYCPEDEDGGEDEEDEGEDLN